MERQLKARIRNLRNGLDEISRRKALEKGRSGRFQQVQEGLCPQLFDLLGEIFPAARRTSRVHPSGDGGNTNQVQHNDRSFLKAGGLNSVFYLTTNQFCRKWIHRKFWARNKNFFRQFSHTKRQGTISLPNFMPQRIFDRLIPGTTQIMEEKSHFSRHWFYGRIRA